MRIIKTKLSLLILLLIIVSSCSENIVDPINTENPIIASFRSETGINAVYVSDTSLLNSVRSWQGHGDYLGIDNWTTARVPDNFDLLGGLPGQSEYYTIEQTIIDTDTMQVLYWESLQVKENPDYGYRPMVGVFDIKDSITVCIARTLANPQYGDGGAWQIYVKNYNDVLEALDTIYLKK